MSVNLKLRTDLYIVLAAIVSFFILSVLLASLFKIFIPADLINSVRFTTYQYERFTAILTQWLYLIVGVSLITGVFIGRIFRSKK